jgi:hypothetical protein
VSRGIGGYLSISSPDSPSVVPAFAICPNLLKYRGRTGNILVLAASIYPYDQTESAPDLWERRRKVVLIRFILRQIFDFVAFRGSLADQVS